MFSNTPARDPFTVSTATADGHMMAQMLSTFSNVEQSRFQAYKRSCFSATAIETWVAACLEDRCGGGGGVSGRPLTDLVAPGQAEEIGLVVAIAAKIYAQRLVAEAVSIQESERQQQQREQQQQSVGDAPVPGTAARSSIDASGAVSCVSVWKAAQERSRRGADPGFFLQPAEDRFNWAAGAATAQHYSVRRLAALAAEEEYDERRARERAEEIARCDAMDVDGTEKKPTGHEEAPGDETKGRTAAPINECSTEIATESGQQRVVLDGTEREKNAGDEAVDAMDVAEATLPSDDA